MKMRGDRAWATPERGGGAPRPKSVGIRPRRRMRCGQHNGYMPTRVMAAAVDAAADTRGDR
jgi:hypothetical protein